MKRLSVFVFIVVLLSGLILPCQADLYFSDNFDDGNTDGWWLGFNHWDFPIEEGNWRIEDGCLVQDALPDHYIALVENLLLSNQTIETQVKLKSPKGYGGVTVWYKDLDNWINVYLYPNERSIFVFENIEGAGSPSGYFRYPYITSEDIWYDLRVDADSINGELALYLNDTYLFTHNTITPYRSGLSGLSCGNGGAYFDNFQITPVPSAVILGGLGLAFASWRLRMMK